MYIGNTCFQFVHSKSYQDIQLRFLTSILTHDHNAITHLLQLYPFHIDSLLQLSNIVKQGGDIAMAAELIERALFAFESCFHPLFRITTGNCQLSYNYIENRYILPIFLEFI